MNQKYPNAETQVTDIQLVKPPVQDPGLFNFLAISENSNQEPTLGLTFR